MRLLTIDVGSYMHGDILLKLGGLGVACRDLFHHFDRDVPERKYRDEVFEETLRRALQEPFDGVFTTNFFPVIARVCHELGVRYLSWCYDAPMNLPSTEEMEHPTNFIFHFDRAECGKYREMGLDTCYHLPLAVNCDRLGRAARHDERFATDVSLMGQLYRPTLSALKGGMTPYQQGYLDAVTEAQRQVYGLWFAGDMLTQELIDGINTQLRTISPSAPQVNGAQLSFAVAEELAHLERIVLPRLIRQTGAQVDLYTGPLSGQDAALLEGIRIHPPVSYGEEMPILFHSSRINLNPSLRCIGSGIPLRALDIVGSGGFLLSNYQPELAEHFADGGEAVLYTSMEEAAEKAAYYLAHEEERREIAVRGRARAEKDFRYEDRLAEMFRIAGMES